MTAPDINDEINNDKDQKFKEWMKKVDTVISRERGISADDLPDCGYRDWFDEGYTPERAASKAVSAFWYDYDDEDQDQDEEDE